MPLPLSFQAIAGAIIGSVIFAVGLLRGSGIAATIRPVINKPTTTPTLHSSLPAIFFTNTSPKSQPIISYVDVT